MGINFGSTEASKHFDMEVNEISCCSLSVASNKKGHTVTLSSLLPLGWGGEWKEKGKNLWVGISVV